MPRARDILNGLTNRFSFSDAAAFIFLKISKPKELSALIRLCCFWLTGKVTGDFSHDVKINADKIEVNENSEGLKKRKKYKFSRLGDINVTPGLHIDIKEGDEKMGHTNLLNFENSIDYDYDIPRLLEDDNFFNNDNSVYLHDLKVLEPFRGKGLSNLLMNECQNQAKNMGMDYITLITSCDNDVAQNLYKKHGYEVYISDGVKDFFYKKIK